MNNAEKFGIAAILFLLLISVLFTSLALFYHNVQGTHIGKLRNVVFDIALTLHQEARELGPLWKNVAVTQHVQHLIFILVSIINYIVISVSLIWLIMKIKNKKTQQIRADIGE